VASIVVAALAIGSLDSEARLFLIASFGCLVSSWALAWSLGDRASRYLADSLLWIGMVLLIEAVYDLAASDGVARSAMLLTLAVFATLSLWQCLTYYWSATAD
jgi:hypothetical protein